MLTYYIITSLIACILGMWIQGSLKTSEFSDAPIRIILSTILLIYSFPTLIVIMLCTTTIMEVSHIIGNYNRE